MSEVETGLPLEELVERRFNDRNELIENLEIQGYNPFHIEYSSCLDGIATTGNRERIMAASFSYLNLGDSSEVQLSVIEAMRAFGATGHGSRVLAGSTQVHSDLEDTLASFIGGEAAITFPTGWIANFSSISALFGPKDTIITDIRNHNSIHAGVEASGAKTIFFNAERPATLRRALKKVDGLGSTLVITDSVFSMDGTIVPLPEILALSKEHGAYLMLDEAHSIGVLGSTGRGITEHFGVDPNDIDILMGNTSKAIAGQGGYIVAKKTVRDFLRYRADGYMFSSSSPPHLVAASLASLRYIDQNPECVAKLQENHRYFEERLTAEGFQTSGRNTPILPIFFPSEEETIQAAKQFWDMGVFVLPAIYPAVPKKSPRLRFCINVAHTKDQLDYMIGCLKKITGDDRLVDLSTS